MADLDLDTVVRTAWEAGRHFERDLLANVLDDIHHAVRPLPRLTHEERVQQRIRLFEECAEIVRAQIDRELAGAPRRPWGCSS